MSISLLLSASASLPCPSPPLLRRGIQRGLAPIRASLPRLGLAASRGDGGERRLVEARRGRAPAAVGVSAEGDDGGGGVRTGITAAAAATVVLAVMNRVLYKLALVPMKDYPFFLAQVLTFGYVIVYFSILFIRYRAGIVSKEMLELPKSRFMLIGLLEAMGVASGMAAAAMLPGPSIPVLSQSFLVWQLILSAIILGRKYRANQILGCLLVTTGVILSVVSGGTGGPFLSDVNFFWPAVLMASSACQAGASIIKEFVFIDGAKRLEGKRPDIFVVNSFGSGFQALFVFLLLPFLSNLKGIPLAELPAYVNRGAACFLNIGGNLNGCPGAPLLPLLFITMNMAFNISVLNLVKMSTALVASLTSTLAAAEKANVQPSKRSSGGFADEDDLLDLDEGFIEPPPKKAKTSSSKPAPAASEASAPATTPVAQVSTASSLSKGKEIPSTAAITASPPPEKPDFRTVISSLEAFASQFISLEADKVRLQKEVESTSSKLDNAVKMIAEACQNADSLKEELERLRNKLKDEEALKLAAEAQRNEKDNLLRQSILALLKAADISADALDKLPDNSPIDALPLTLESSKLIQALLQKNKEVMSRMHSMIFPKADKNKTLEQLTDAFVVDTKETIEVFKRTSRTYGALLAFQLMMGHGFKADMEQMSKELPKEQDGQLIDLSVYKSSARKCALQLLELVSANKSAAGPSLSTQTQAP